MQMPMSHVLDACAVIAFLRDEEGAETVEAMLENNECFIHSINLYEVYKDVLLNGRATEDARAIIDDLSPVLGRLAHCSDDEMRRAAEIKVRYRGQRLAIPDAIGVAAAEHRRWIFVTSDHAELDRLESDGFPVAFFR